VSKIISFAWTTEALLAGHKTVTRRNWQDSYAAKFRPGEIVQAYDRQPRFKGRKVAVIRILSVTKEPNYLIPDSDYEAEGFAWARENGAPHDAIADLHEWDGFCDWRNNGETMWVIRFELLEVTS
jgi:hypothetical protein